MIFNKRYIQIMKKFLNDILKDKDGEYSLREMATVVFVLILVMSWAARFLGLHVDEFMFYGFSGLVCSSLFGYSFERMSRPKNPDEELYREGRP